MTEMLDEEVSMKHQIGKSEVEIEVDDEGIVYLEAGSEGALFSFMAFLGQEPEGVLAYAETHITYIEEVTMSQATDSDFQVVAFDRIDLIHMMTNLIDSSGVTEINDRDDAAALAIIIVNGLPHEKELLEERKQQ